jgi:hypothetical protein
MGVGRPARITVHSGSHTTKSALVLIHDARASEKTMLHLYVQNAAQKKRKTAIDAFKRRPPGRQRGNRIPYLSV